MSRNIAVKVYPLRQTLLSHSLLRWLPYLFVYFGGVVYTQYFLNAGFYTDQRIYHDAAVKALTGGDPYLPFNIPASFVYPPAILPFFALLNMVQFDLARILWTDLNILLYLGVLYLLWQWLKPAFNLRSLIIFGMLLFYGPLSENVTIGQVDVINLLGFTLFVTSLDYTNSRLSAGSEAGWRERWWGGFGLAVALLIKFTPGMLVLILLRHRLWKRVGDTLLSSIFLASFSVITFGWGIWLSFAQIVPDMVVAGSSDVNNQRITNTLAVLMKTAEANPTVRLMGSLFSAVVLGTWLLVLLFKSKRDNLVPVALLGIVSLTISSSLVWYHHFLFLLLPVMYLLIRYEGSKLAWFGWAGLTAIQLDRVAEHAFKWPPVISQFGYLTLFVAMLLINLRQPAKSSATAPKAEVEAPVIPAAERELEVLHRFSNA